MNKQIAQELDVFVNEIAQRFSHGDREMNFNNETFTVKEIVPLSDHTAAVVYSKNTGKDAIIFCYYIVNGVSKGWKYFFPTDSHILGFRAFEVFKLLVEHHNYKFNF